MSAPHRILVVCPAFHGYGHAIAHALRRIGHDTMLCNYDENSAAWTRLRHKLVFELPDRISSSGAGYRAMAAEQTRRAIRAVESSQPDAVLIVRGDVLGPPFWDLLAREHVPHVTWFYDEVRRMDFGEPIADAISRRGIITTYSALDAATLVSHGYSAHHLPLAYDADAEPRTRPSRDIVFIGARYGKREEYLEALQAGGIGTHAYGRTWSRHPIDRLRTWSWSRPPIPAGRDLPRVEAYGVMAGALGTLNVHGDQDGFTMRTFEASGVGGLQLIDRDDVAELYEPGKEVLVFHSPDELVDLARRAAVDTPWAQRIREAGRRRTLAEHTFDHRVRELEALWS